MISFFKINMILSTNNEVKGVRTIVINPIITIVVSMFSKVLSVIPTIVIIKPAITPYLNTIDGALYKVYQPTQVLSKAI